MKTILIVEKDEMYTQNLQFHLEQRNYQVVTSSNGKTAYEIAHQIVPDLILSEIVLPGMGGLRLCSELQQSSVTNNIPIVFNTASTDLDDHKKALKLGATKYLTKPLKIKTLLDTIYELIGNSSLSNDRILFISEDVKSSTGLKEYLKSKGYRILLKGMYEDTVDEKKAAHSDLIILEFLNETDTIDEKIISFTKEPALSKIPIIVLGTRNESSVFRKTMSAEASDYFANPVEYSKILTSIEMHLDKKKFNQFIDSSIPPDTESIVDKELIAAIATRKELRNRKQKSILIIEDDTELLNNLRMQLELNRFIVLSGVNGETGIELAEINLPDLIISDIMLPGISGYEVRKQLNNKIITRNIPFLFLSAKVEYEDIRKGMALGADDYLTKPIKIKNLLHIIKKKLNSGEKSESPNKPLVVEELASAVKPTLAEKIKPSINDATSFSKLFKYTREIIPAEGTTPPGTVQPAAEINPAVAFQQNKYSIFEAFYSLPKENADYQSFAHMDTIVVRVNLLRGVEKESKEFLLFLLTVAQQKKLTYIVDLFSAEFLDATFLGVIVMFRKKVSQLGGRVKLVIHSKVAVSNPIFLQGLYRIFDIHEDIKSAILSD